MAAGTAVDTRNFVDKLVSVENVEGTGYDDIIIADAGGNSLESNQGNDIVRGGLDSDWITGGEGNDTLDGGAGGDDFDVLSCRDEYVWQNGIQGVVVNFSVTTQLGVLAGRATDTFGGTDTVSNFDRVEGTSFVVTVFAAQLTGNGFQFEGYAGNDVLVGTANGRDRLNYDRDQQ